MSYSRSVYLNMKTSKQTKKIILEKFDSTLSKIEVVPVNESVGRVLAVPVVAAMSSPHFNSAAMDGIAVKAEYTFGASELKPKELTLNEKVIFVNTGQKLPEGTNAVIMIEHAQILNNNKIKIENPVFPWQNVRKIGEDIIATQLLYTRNHVITPYCLGSIISAGVYEVSVRKKPKILVIPTGSELVDWKKTKPGKIEPGFVLETNSYILEKLIEKSGGKCIKHDAILDDFDLISSVISEAVKEKFDIILTIGGSSAGSHDYAFAVANKLGNIFVHGVTIMPGKPIIVADIGSKPFFGLPGYTVSTIIAFEKFVYPLICKMLCVQEEKREVIKVIPFRRITSKLGIQEFLRVKLGKVGKNIIATPLSRGAGTITSMTEADGIISIPRQIEGIEFNKIVRAELLKPVSKVKNTIVVAGSHDYSLDILADELRKKNIKYSLSSSHIGSMAGLIAVKKGLCHLAGCHLLDDKTGEYNITYIKKIITNMKVKVINLVQRNQGLIIYKGNPKNIKNVRDLTKKGIKFVNRQKGSGTRILLDYTLLKNKIDINGIKGYNREEFTHMDVAMAVLSGSADVGLGIYAASNILGLDFVPLVTEQYDLIVRKNVFMSRKVTIIMEIIKSLPFRKKINNLGGYDTKNIGKIV